MTGGWILLFAATAIVADAPATVRFIACPIYRDTGTKAKAGCWLADDPATGTRYDVTSSPTKPDWNRAVLVEGVPANAATDLCGGTILDPARVSVLDQPCTRFMLEPEGFPGRTFKLPSRNTRPLYELRQPAAKPWIARTFTIPFDFAGTFIGYQLADYYIDRTIAYALDTQARRIIVDGHAQTTPITVSGIVLAEDSALAAERAAKVRDALILRGVPRDRISLAALSDREADLEPFDGLSGPEQRRVDVRIEP